MFEYIRTHQRLMQFLLLLIIFPSFAFFGIESYTRSQAAAGANVATVAGQSITQQELDNALREQMDTMRQNYGPQFDPKMFNTPEVRQNVLDELIARKAVTEEIRKQNVSIADATLQQELLRAPGLQNANGAFDNDKYKQVLAQRGMTPAVYEQRMRQNMAFEQLLGSVQNTGFLPRAVAERIALITEQEREVQVLNLKAADFAAQVKVTDDMIKAYYDKNAALFEIPETMKAQYVVLTADALAAQVTVSEDDIAGFYKSNTKTYTSDEQRKVSHILIGFAKNASDDVKAKAKAKAETLLTEVRKNPAVFAKLAKENSDDPGSKEQGGDLGVMVKDAFVKPFEAAALKLKQGEISEPVLTDYGYHIIYLTELHASAVKPLDEVRAQIAADIKKQKAAKSYSEAAEAFTDAVYQQADSLQAVADKWKLKLEVADGLSKQGNPGVPATSPVNNPKFLKALFSDEVIKKKHNTEAVEIAPSTLMAGRMVEYKAASKRPLDEVKAAIVAKITQTEAEVLAEKEGKAKLAALKAADAVAGFSDVKVISRAKTEDVSPQAFSAIMKADVQKLPAFVGVNMPGAGYAVYRISKVNAGNPDAARRASDAQQIANLVAQQELTSYIDLLKKKAKASVNKETLKVSPETN
ncbi:SurA N-terminal domain-containing protein [Undibacterium crateris]|uniref:SurA N-terminal domain-containing protein n=1 Tax=Undibacterium crateris TaxID=2528175 RepID=UPI00138A155F|nr:SurA N-terminal domain-containing protein [Undibacterium crateris]NDI84051.1 peptidylprolyl isomerase [Undibacterium crateris]